LIQKEDRRRKREAGNEAEPLDIYSQALPGNKRAEPGN